MALIPSNVSRKKVGYIIITILYSVEKELCIENAGRLTKNITALCLTKESCKDVMAGKALLYALLF